MNVLSTTELTVHLKIVKMRHFVFCVTTHKEKGIDGCTECVCVCACERMRVSGFKGSAVEERKGGLSGETAEELTPPARKSSWTGERSLWLS